MLIQLDQFGGIMPKVAPHLLPVKQAAVAVNCRLGSGGLDPWHEPGAVSSLAKTGTIKSLYHYNDQFWFHWLEDVDVAQAPVALDNYGRVYWTGESYPRVGGSDIVTSGGGALYPTASFKMGVPAPSAVTVAVTGTASDALAPKERVYVRTYVTDYGAEGPPSDPSSIVEVANGQSCTVTLPTETLSGYNITLQKIYRTETGSDETKYMLVDTIVIASTSYSDTKAAATLTVPLPSLTWDGPPTDMKGLAAHPMGSLVGFLGKEVLFSEPFRPHAWPYRYAVSDPVVAIGVYGTYVLVTTTGKPYLISGSDPASMTCERLEKGEACVSKRGLVDMGTVCVFPGPSGLWGAGTGDIALLTDKIMAIEDWRAYKPESILGTFYDGEYIGFYNTGSKTGGFVFNPASGDFTEIDTYATAAWNDPKTGRLYLVVSGAVVEWNAGANPVTYTWRSRPYISPSPVNVACAKVVAESYPVTCKVYADGTLKHTQTVANGDPFWLPSGFRATEWSVEVVGAKKVKQVAFAGSIKELLGA